MEKSTYDSMMTWLGQRPQLARGLSLTNKAITGLVYIAYPALIIWMACTNNPELLRAILVPVISFVLVTLVRNLLNSPRPYEVFDRKSIMPKKTKGKSMPSRHVFSITIIAMTYFAVFPTPIVGIALLVVSVVLAVIRVVTGVHFIKDVVCGIIIGVVCGILGFYVILV